MNSVKASIELFIDLFTLLESEYFNNHRGILLSLIQVLISHLTESID